MNRTAAEMRAVWLLCAAGIKVFFYQTVMMTSTFFFAEMWLWGGVNG